MDILPVIDLLKGVVVRGVAGRRDEYRPVVSCLADSARPLAVARAFRERLGFTRLYLADLDGILQGAPHVDLFRTLSGEGFQLLVDAGLRDADAAEALFDAGVQGVIVGLETSSGPRQIETLCGRYGAERMIFSLDLMRGSPLAQTASWGTADAWQIARAAVEAGIERMIVLDLSGVGVGEGVGTRELCAQLRGAYPNLHILTGGGVRGVDDLRLLQAAGVDGVLVASALHNGALGRAELQGLRSNVSG